MSEKKSTNENNSSKKDKLDPKVKQTPSKNCMEILLDDDDEDLNNNLPAAKKLKTTDNKTTDKSTDNKLTDKTTIDNTKPSAASFISNLTRSDYGRPLKRPSNVSNKEIFGGKTSTNENSSIDKSDDYIALSNTTNFNRPILQLPNETIRFRSSIIGSFQKTPFNVNNPKESLNLVNSFESILTRNIEFLYFNCRNPNNINKFDQDKLIKQNLTLRDKLLDFEQIPQIEAVKQNVVRHLNKFNLILIGDSINEIDLKGLSKEIEKVNADLMSINSSNSIDNNQNSISFNGKFPKVSRDYESKITNSHGTYIKFRSSLNSEMVNDELVEGKIHHITAMEEYEESFRKYGERCLEELRYEDYYLKRVFGRF